MVSVRGSSLVECCTRGTGAIFLERIDRLQKGDLIADPITGDLSIIETIVHKTHARMEMYRLFGLDCAGAQVAKYGTSWQKVATLSNVDVTVAADITLYGLVLRHEGNEARPSVRIDGVICRGIYHPGGMS